MKAASVERQWIVHELFARPARALCCTMAHIVQKFQFKCMGFAIDRGVAATGGA